MNSVLTWRSSAAASLAARLAPCCAPGGETSTDRTRYRPPPSQINPHDGRAPAGQVMAKGTNHGPAVDGGQPGYQRITKRSRQTKRHKEPLPRNPQSAGSKQQRHQRKRRRKQRRNGHGNRTVLLYPPGQSLSQIAWADNDGAPLLRLWLPQPKSNSHQDGPHDGRNGRQHGSAAMGHEQNQEQIRAARHRQGNDRRIDHRHHE